MQIPQHWAEARVEGQVGTGSQARRRVVRRFGWSDASVEAAQAHADDRAAQAFADLLAGRDVVTRERKLAYGGAGLPIREEVVARNDSDVVTRNSYGARCLNEPDVLFADIDFDPRLHPAVEFAFATAMRFAGLGGFALALTRFWQGEMQRGYFGLIAATLVPALLFAVRTWLRNHPGTQSRYRTRLRQQVEQVAQAQPNGRFALYDTPAGLRLLALHQTYDPRSESVMALFRALAADPAYVQMCALQACFRARVSPKPWRMGMRRPPTSSVWPVPAARMDERAAWVDAYEVAARGYSACRFVGEFGEGTTNARCGAVQLLHDEMSGARGGLPMA